MRRAVFLVLTLLLAACQPPPPVKLGFIAGVSGRFADLGGVGRNGAQLAVEMRNQAGGINGRKVELLVRDDQQDAETARAAVHDLAAQGVVAIVGPMTSVVGAAIAPTLNESGLVAIAGTVTTTSLTGRDDNFFRVISTTRIYARNNALECLRRFGAKRASILIDQANADYTESWMQDFKAAFEEKGGKIVSVIRFDSRQAKNFQQIASQALSVKPDLIGLASNATDAAMLVQKLRQLNPDIAVTGGGWAASERLLELGGRAVEGMLVEQYYNRHDQSDSYAQFLRAYRQRFGQDPGYAGVAGFDAANVAMEAIARGATRETFKATLLRLRTFRGLQDEIRFDDFGDANRRLHMTLIDNGRFVPLERQ